MNDEYFRNGAPLSFTLAPRTYLKEDGDGWAVGTTEGASPDTKDRILRYMEGEVFRRYLEEVIDNTGSAWPGSFSFWYGFRVEHVHVASLGGDGDSNSPAVRVFGRVYAKEVSHAWMCEIWAHLLEGSGSGIERIFRKLKWFVQDAQKKRKRVLKHMRRLHREHVTYGSLLEHISRSLSDNTLIGDLPSDPACPEAPHIYLNVMKDVVAYDLADDGNDVWRRDRIDALTTQPYSVMARAAARWKRTLTNPHHPKGREFLMRQFRVEEEGTKK